MTPDLRQRIAVSALISSAEKICASGRLPESEEMALRYVIASVRSAFGPELPERGNVIVLEDATLELVRREMERT